MTPTVIPLDAHKYAPVLQLMIEIIGKEQNTTFEDAMNRAARELKLEVPAHMQDNILRAAYRIIATGGIPGAPEA